MFIISSHKSHRDWQLQQFYYYCVTSYHRCIHLSGARCCCILCWRVTLLLFQVSALHNSCLGLAECHSTCVLLSSCFPARRHSSDCSDPQLAALAGWVRVMGEARPGAKYAVHYSTVSHCIAQKAETVEASISQNHKYFFHSICKTKTLI